MLLNSKRLAIFTALGIRFWDPVLADQVGDGLVVTAWPDEVSGPVFEAFRTRSGIYAFQGLPGLRNVEYPLSDTVVIASPPDSRRFVVEVSDPQKRYFPAAFTVDLPLPYRGIFPTAAPGSPPDDQLPGFYLYSASTRTAASGLAALRGQLLEANTLKPAAYAVIEVIVDGQTWYGIADARGSVLVLLPYPTFITLLGQSPPDNSLSEQEWELTIRVLYNPTTLTELTGTEVPHLHSILDQAAGTIWPTESGPPVSSWLTDLTFGQELVMRTGNLSYLWVSPAP